MLAVFGIAGNDDDAWRTQLHRRSHSVAMNGDHIPTSFLSDSLDLLSTAPRIRALCVSLCWISLVGSAISLIAWMWAQWRFRYHRASRIPSTRLTVWLLLASTGASVTSFLAAQSSIWPSASTVELYHGDNLVQSRLFTSSASLVKIPASDRKLVRRQELSEVIQDSPSAVTPATSNAASDTATATATATTNTSTPLTPLTPIITKRPSILQPVLQRPTSELSPVVRDASDGDSLDLDGEDAAPPSPALSPSPSASQPEHQPEQSSTTSDQQHQEQNQQRQTVTAAPGTLSAIEVAPLTTRTTMVLLYFSRVCILWTISLAIIHAFHIWRDFITRSLQSHLSDNRHLRHKQQTYHTSQHQQQQQQRQYHEQSQQSILDSLHGSAVHGGGFNDHHYAWMTLLFSAGISLGFVFDYAVLFSPSVMTYSGNVDPTRSQNIRNWVCYAGPILAACALLLITIMTLLIVRGLVPLIRWLWQRVFSANSRHQNPQHKHSADDGVDSTEVLYRRAMWSAVLSCLTGMVCGTCDALFIASASLPGSIAANWAGQRRTLWMLGILSVPSSGILLCGCTIFASATVWPLLNDIGESIAGLAMTVFGFIRRITKYRVNSSKQQRQQQAHYRPQHPTQRGQYSNRHSPYGNGGFTSHGYHQQDEQRHSSQWHSGNQQYAQIQRHQMQQAQQTWRDSINDAGSPWSSPSSRLSAQQPPQNMYQQQHASLRQHQQHQQHQYQQQQQQQQQQQHAPLQSITAVMDGHVERRTPLANRGFIDLDDEDGLSDSRSGSHSHSNSRSPSYPSVNQEMKVTYDHQHHQHHQSLRAKEEEDQRGYQQQYNPFDTTAATSNIDIQQNNHNYHHNPPNQHHHHHHKLHDEHVLKMRNETMMSLTSQSRVSSNAASEHLYNQHNPTQQNQHQQQQHQHQPVMETQTPFSRLPHAQQYLRDDEDDNDNNENSNDTKQNQHQRPRQNQQSWNINGHISAGYLLDDNRVSTMSNLTTFNPRYRFELGSMMDPTTTTAVSPTQSHYYGNPGISSSSIALFDREPSIFDVAATAAPAQNRATDILDSTSTIATSVNSSTNNGSRGLGYGLLERLGLRIATNGTEPSTQQTMAANQADRNSRLPYSLYLNQR